MLRGKAMEQKPKEGGALNKIACNNNSPKQDEALACIVSGLNLVAWHVDRAMESRWSGLDKPPCLRFRSSGIWSWTCYPQTRSPRELSHHSRISCSTFQAQNRTRLRMAHGRMSRYLGVSWKPVTKTCQLLNGSIAEELGTNPLERGTTRSWVRSYKNLFARHCVWWVFKWKGVAVDDSADIYVPRSALSYFYQWIDLISQFSEYIGIT